MKKSALLVIASCLIIIIGQGCINSSVPTTMEETTTLSILVDATDSVIFNDILSDFEVNVYDFLQRTGIGKIGKGERLNLKMSPITANGDLRVRQATIGVGAGEDLSGKELEKRTDLRYILCPMVSELDHYDTMVRTEQQLSSPIIDVILKCIREMDGNNSREILMVFTDGYENSNYLNMYKRIPTTEDQILAIMDKIDPVLLKEATTRISEVDPELLLVLKCKNDSKGQVKLFYSELCKQLGIKKVTFLDNMTNSVNL